MTGKNKKSFVIKKQNLSYPFIAFTSNKNKRGILQRSCLFFIEKKITKVKWEKKRKEIDAVFVYY